MRLLVELFRARFASRAAASCVIVTARSLGLDVEVRDVGGGAVLVIVETPETAAR